MIETKLSWKERFTFSTELDNHTFMLDVDKENGGDDRGPRPKGLVLSALAACTGMDVVSILDKMKFKNYNFDLKVTADTEETHPKVFKDVELSYIFEGDLKPDSVKKAISLSKDKYCAVSAMLQKAVDIKVKIFLNGVEI
ncbi:MAG: OsmC family protein [Candidatus Cloacimonadales bacterium]|jgi:putative redox protein|nr:OsmC family protein [Candidatus Cloacimonadota bacterium]MDD2651027.1 OsmC family protein [Candidatus Cloacimonadota bacterium]MDX9977909.1 OsmC family protein [Candidatus Cloacimonadales bacterium]